MKADQDSNLNAFTLVELMITVVIIGIVSGITISIIGNELRREKVNTVVQEFVGWLEAIRGASLARTSTITTSGGCQVTISSPSANQGSGSTVATVSPAECSPSPNFILTDVAAGSSTFSWATANQTITFTPRGSIAETSDITFKIVQSGTAPLRCVRVSAGLGLIRIGRNDSATQTSASCTDYIKF
ncbi:GspH/FimT family pseudopilin [Synechococcus sp. CBW1002]|uniref:GspH/FimT family pseudopilin n=1 Tax=unclassified Synechococcus TaxID=2626047 RepID=UPI0018CE35AA|nr:MULTISPECIES: GspH/FimT family pseudopilin [unclassified Synechococcus]QPN58968.1 GspH/FimT family pseudopilin [Synechococcus sp. CBW1002]QPN65683.1 GspH/FimT family pseudopilin [Synechococcus sp. CBW1006]